MPEINTQKPLAKKKKKTLTMQEWELEKLELDPGVITSNRLVRLASLHLFSIFFSLSPLCFPFSILLKCK